MDDKDKLFSGVSKILLYPANETPATAVPLDGIVAYSLQILSEDDSDIIDEDVIATHSTAGSYSVDLGNITTDYTQLAKISGMDYSRDSFVSVRIDEVIKPKNLKYPRKRRKLRIYKKWAKRFGYKHFIIPKCSVNVEMSMKNNTILKNITLTAQNIS